MISLTALTGGIAPAFAKPDEDPVAPSTTVVVPAPEVSVQEPEVVKPEKPAEAPAPAAPEAPPSQPSVQLPPQTQAPQTQAPQTQAPQTQAPQSPAAVESEPETQAPAARSTAVAPPVTSVEPAEPSEQEPPTAERAPVTSAAPSTASATPGTTSAPATESDSAETPVSSAAPSAALAPASDPSQAPASSSIATPKSGESEAPTVSITQAAKEIETVEPQTLEAPENDVQLAKSAKPVFEERPAPAAKEDVAAFSQSIDLGLGLNGKENRASARSEINLQRDRDFELVSNVRQWRPDWVEYDEYYRPIVLNPFRAPVRIVYIYDFAPRIVYIPPLAMIVLEAVQFAAYSFTAAVLAPINAAIDVVQAAANIAVGSFFGGGYFPGIGQPFPAPPRLLRYDNVPVLVNYSQARYEPFRVRQIVDVGDDRQYGERKVLLDGVTPAWGVWNQTPTGERQFEVHRTQQFPGLDAPAEAPLPGDYRLRLAADESPSSGLTGRDIFLFVTAGVIGTLGFGAIGLAFFLGRRRPQH